MQAVGARVTHGTGNRIVMSEESKATEIDPIKDDEKSTKWFQKEARRKGYVNASKTKNARMLAGGGRMAYVV